MIYLGTKNKDKVRETQEILGMPVEGVAFDVEEIQSLDILTVVEKKARDYFACVKKPILVEDTGLIFTALGKLPGTYVKDFLDNIGNLGLVNLLPPDETRGAIAQTAVAYCDGTKVISFLGEIRGVVSLKPRGTDGFGWDQIFIPDGLNQTLAEMSPAEKNKISSRAIALEKFIEWFVKQYPN